MIQPGFALRHPCYGRARAVGVAMLGCAALLPAAANAERAAERTDIEHSRFEIITSAMGLERYTEYSAHREALGVAWAGHFGMEAAYYGLGESRFAARRGGTRDNIGGRADVKLAVDVFAPLNGRARLYSRVGMYWWDIDVNYNRLDNELDKSRAGTSHMVGIGAVYGTRPLRVGIELEQLSADSLDAPQEEQRVLFNLFSQY